MPANITAADVAVTLIPQDMDYSGQAKIKSYPSVTFGAGDGSMLYPPTGVPLPPIAKFGLKKALKRLYIQDQVDGFVRKYDKVNHSIRIYQGNAGGQITTDPHTHDILLIGGITATEPVAVQGGDTLGKNAATNRTIAGADVVTKGGVKPTTVTAAAGAIVAAALVELGHVAVGVTTLDLEVIGL